MITLPKNLQKMYKQSVDLQGVILRMQDTFTNEQMSLIDEFFSVLHVIKIESDKKFCMSKLQKILDHCNELSCSIENIENEIENLFENDLVTP